MKRVSQDQREKPTPHSKLCSLMTLADTQVITHRKSVISFSRQIKTQCSLGLWLIISVAVGPNIILTKHDLDQDQIYALLPSPFKLSSRSECELNWTELTERRVQFRLHKQSHGQSTANGIPTSV